MPQMSQDLIEHAFGMLTAGMSTRAVACELNVRLSTISHLRRHFKDFGSRSNRPHNRRPHVTTPAQDLHIQYLPSKIIWDQPPGQLLQQSVCITKLFLHARHPHLGLDLTAVCHRNWLDWANAYIRWCLALWMCVLFTDESRFSLYRADGRQRLWRSVGERFADVNIVVEWRMVVVGLWYGGQAYLMDNEHRWILLIAFECTAILWRDPEAHCCAIHPRPSPHVAAW